MAVGVTVVVRALAAAALILLTPSARAGDTVKVGVLLPFSGPFADAGMQIGKSVGTIPTDLLLIGRALGLLDGITKQLDPSMDTMEIIAHYAE